MPGNSFLLMAAPIASIHLRYRASRQYQISLFEDQRKVGPGTRRVEADGGPELGIPEFGVVKAGSPRALHHAHETVFAANDGFIAMLSEDQDVGIRCDGLRCSAASQRYLCISLHQVLFERGNAWIGVFASCARARQAAVSKTSKPKPL